jgi:hypothetical protein
MLAEYVLELQSEANVKIEHPGASASNDNKAARIDNGQRDSVFSDWVIRILLAAITLTSAIALLLAFDLLPTEGV